MLERLVRRRLLKRVLDARVTDFKPEIRDMLPQLGSPQQRGVRGKLEAAIAERLAELTDQGIDADSVVVNIFSIRSVRETARNSEAGILVAEPEPKPFEQVSTLFASINERYADEYVEVYAPLDWPTDTDKTRLRRKVREPILELIESHCRASMEGATA